MNYTIKIFLFSFLALFPLVSISHAIKIEGVCVDVTYPLNGCDALQLCPELCRLRSQVWTGGFGTSTTLCEDQQKDGNSICECKNE